MAPPRVDRLVKVLGGEENLPAKLPRPSTDVQEADTEAKEVDLPKGDFNSMQSVMNNFKHGELKDGEDWWNATPRLPQPAQPTQTEQNAPWYTDRGEVRFNFDPRKDEPAPLGISFSPFAAVAKFPYKFVKREFQQKIASAFFDEGKIYSREWDLYYIWSDHYQTAKPVTFVPEYQLFAVIDEINKKFEKAHVTITDELREEGLLINFDDIDRVDLRPRFLGHSTSRAQIEDWTSRLPFPPEVQGTMQANDRSVKAFQAKMELANEIAKNKKKASGKHRHAEAVVKRQNMVRMLLRAQRYLGMVAKSDDSLLPDISSLSLAALDVTKAAPHPFDSDAIYIAVDVEAYERVPHPITEVGIATLDTRDLQGHAPGINGRDWQQFIRARHFRIQEYNNANYVNKDFVEGCPDKFEFGDSEFIGEDKICKAVADCFKEPYSGPAAAATEDTLGEKRNLILVGHDTSQDINYLRKLGFSVSNCSNIIDTMDTAAMFRAYTHDPNARSLGNVLYEFDLAGWNLHNAGNDAVYTLWAMLAICTKAASERGSPDAEKKRTEQVEKRTEVAIEQAKEQVKDAVDGWDSPGDDGGVPVPPRHGNGVPKAPQGEKNRRLYTVGGAILDV